MLPGVQDMSGVNRRHRTSAAAATDTQVLMADDELPVTLDQKPSEPSWLVRNRRRLAQTTENMKWFMDSQNIMDWFSTPDTEGGRLNEPIWKTRARTLFHDHWTSCLKLTAVTVVVSTLVILLLWWQAAHRDISQLEALPAAQLDTSLQYTVTERQMLPFLPCKPIAPVEMESGRLESGHVLTHVEAALRSTSSLALAAVHIKLNRCLVLLRQNETDPGLILYNPQLSPHSDTGRVKKVTERSIFCKDQVHTTERSTKLVIQHTDPLLQTTLLTTFVNDAAFRLGGLLSQLAGTSHCT